MNIMNKIAKLAIMWKTFKIDKKHLKIIFNLWSKFFHLYSELKLIKLDHTHWPFWEPQMNRCICDTICRLIVFSRNICWGLKSVVKLLRLSPNCGLIFRLRQHFIKLKWNVYELMYSVNFFVILNFIIKMTHATFPLKCIALGSSHINVCVKLFNEYQLILNSLLYKLCAETSRQGAQF